MAVLYCASTADVKSPCVPIVIGVLGVCACSSSPPPPSIEVCQPFAACGGDVSGTWEIDSDCLTITPPFSDPACQSVVSQSSFTATGTVIYASATNDPTQGTEQVDAHFAFVIEEVFSGACLVALGLVGPSEQACDGLQTYFAGPYAVTCAPDSGTCRCQFSDDETVQQSDTYVTDGQSLTLASSGNVSFCRTGDVLVEAQGTSSLAGLRMHLQAP
ncbi:MAG TPA: hypothetical protein VGM06_06425 [Polyangiaceae bacterium]